MRWQQFPVKRWDGEPGKRKSPGVWGASALALVLLVACHSHDELTASEAIQAADLALAEQLPQMKHHMADVKAEMDTRQNRWVVEYYGGTGGATIYVDVRSGQTTIAKIEQ